MLSSQIRSTFTDFFRERGHLPVPASPLVPAEPTLLLTNAGMNQFTPYFVGTREPEHRRLTTVQKCVRTSDIARVGRTTRHATCFEMLGNFSFGDYFKQETVAWAWELLTSTFGLPPERLWITVYEDDDETERLWRRIGVPSSRIQRLGMADNFWSMGVPGPCGPNSDVNYDRGPAFGTEGGPAVNSERYVELWGLVFMAFLRGEGDGKDSYPIVGELPAPSIDTGLGLDRLACVLQDVDTVCETDLLAPTLRAVEERAGRPYPGRDGGEESVSFRVVTEHVRSAAHLIADGVLPDRDGRGYVLRRLLRRAVHHARRLGIQGPVLSDLSETVVQTLGSAWPELDVHRDLIRRTVLAEEEGFHRTLRQGSRLLETAITRARAEGAGRLPDSTAFALHDTYGFPIDLTLDVARAAGLTVDEEAFRARLERQRRRARQVEQDRKGRVVERRDTYRRIAAQHGATGFVGYDRTVAEGRLLALVEGGRMLDEAHEGARVEVVLDRSPFYAESGGQVGDTGTIRTSGGAELQVLDTTYAVDGLQVHSAVVTGGEVRPGLEIEASVDSDRRAATARSHTATHVLHAVLRRLLGEHAVQRGSRVEPGRLRIDFAHPNPLGPGRLAEIQELVDQELLADPEVRVWHTSLAEAEAAGATALFGESYGDEVRVVDIGEISRELCGGTHVGHGAGAGPVILLGESSVGTGLRRIEALTGADALGHRHRERALLDELAALLKVPSEEAPNRLRQRLDDLARAERELARLRAAELEAEASRLAGTASRTSGGWLVGEIVTRVSAAELRSLGRDVLTRLPAPGGVVILGAEVEGKAVLSAGVGETAARVMPARRLLAEAATVLEGGAGGDDRQAQAGGRRADRLAEALVVAVRSARDVLDGRR